ncbi:PAS domain S-box protein [Hymenobacter sediminis]|uniref:PAS domain S-box protein n=1 Tax=Hymenobacter sediminis TaxID=2218621 RepID=UPI000F4F471A|nr:PAS domain S-box protein [Hymenobacter sediminis]RPD46170.1 PAS domain S-box protein [Hymenobacter sediminis]
MPTPDSTTDTTALAEQLAQERRERIAAEQQVQSLRRHLNATQRVVTRLTGSITRLTQNLRVAVLVVHQNGRVVLLNQEFCDLFGLEDAEPGMQEQPADPLLEAFINQSVQPENTRQRLENLRTANQRVLGADVELSDSTVLEMDFIPLSGQDDLVPSGYMLSFRDVTQARRAEQYLNSLSRIPGQNPNPVLRLHANGRVLYANPAAEELRQEYVAPQTEPDFARQLYQAASEALTAGQPIQTEIGFDHHCFQLAIVPFVNDQYVNLYFTDITQVKDAEKRLVEQQEFYETVLNQLPADVAVFDTEQRYRFVNPAAIRDASLREWIIGHNDFEYFEYRQRPLELAQRRRAIFQRAIQQRGAVAWEETLDTPEGQRLSLRHMQPVFGPEGELRMVIGYGLDITERHEAEEKVRQSEARLQEQQNFVQQVVNTTPIIIWVCDEEGKIQFSNQAFEDLIKTGRHRSTTSRSPHDPVATEIWAHEQSIKQVLKSRQEIAYESSFTQLDGYVRYFQTVVRPLPRADGSINVMGVSTDITEMKQAGNTLERTAKQYRDLMHYSQALICTHDLEGIILSVNPAAAQLVGVVPDLLIGRTLYDVLTPDLHPQLEVYLKQAHQQQELTGLMTLRGPDGRPHHLIYNNYRVEEPGELPYVIAYGQEITERIQAEHELLRAKEAAENTARAKENFLANMSHEIRTPINGVLGMAGLLAKSPLNPTQQEHLRILRNSGRHLLTVINDVLDVAKIEAGKLELEQMAFDLNQSIQDGVQSLAFRAEEKGIGFRLELVPLPHPVVIGDPGRINQILLNLLSNAVKFTTQGEVVLASRLLEETDSELALEFEVRDTGIGIPPEKQEAIFESFSQAYADISRRFGGTGLGLTISRSLVQQLGGQMWVESELNQGSRFFFSLALPKAHHSLPEPTLLPPPNYSHLRGKRVLLVEDHPVNQQLAMMILEGWEVETHVASDGLEALDQLEARLYDVVLMDIQMPGLSGLDVTHRLRQHPDPLRATTPVIALTANVMRSDDETYRAAGLDYLSKPFEEDDLFRKLEANLRPVPVDELEGQALPPGLPAPPQPEPLHTPAAAPVPEPDPLFDLTMLRDTAHGSTIFMQKIVGSFRAHTPVAVAQLREAAAAEDWLAVGMVVHKLRPSMQLLGIQAAQEAAAVLEPLSRLAPDATLPPSEQLNPAAQQLADLLEAAVEQLANAHIE